MRFKRNCKNYWIISEGTFYVKKKYSWYSRYYDDIFLTSLGDVYTLYYHDYKLFYLYLQYGTTITPEKTKQAMETIQSVLVEKLDKKFDHVEVSNLFYVHHPRPTYSWKILACKVVFNSSEAKTQVSFSDQNKSSCCLRY